MKMVPWKCVVLVAIVLLVSACGGEGGKGDNGAPMSTLTLNSESLTSGQTRTTYAGNSSSFYSPVGILFADGLSIDIYKPIGGSEFSQLFHLQTDGAAVQEYPVGVRTFFDYDMLNSYYSSLTGTITITDIPKTSGYVKGSFDSLVSLSSNPSETARMWGTFSVFSIRSRY